MYTTLFTYLQRKKSRGVRSGDLGGLCNRSPSPYPFLPVDSASFVLIDNYTVLIQHRVGQGKGIATGFHRTLKVNKCTVSTKAEVGSSSTFLDSYKHVNKQTEVDTITLDWCTLEQKNKNSLTKINGNFETTRRFKKQRLFNKKCSLLLTLSTLRVCRRGFESPCIWRG